MSGWSNKAFLIRPFAESDWPSIWAFIEPVFRAGETYAVDTDIGESAARASWIDRGTNVYVVADETDRVVGVYYLKANHAGPGGHVCNCGYIVAAAARGQGLAERMCLHSHETGLRLGFRAMHFNCVVSTNTTAIKLWQKLGFEIVGTLPKAFDHPVEGFVDAYVMFKQLAPQRDNPDERP
ncbi:MAG: N-acetyltransferase [Planctomycetota bacterium]